jgi:choline transport protein
MKEDAIETVAEDAASGSLEDLKSVSSDDALLMSMGKKPELKRVYNFWTCTLTSLPEIPHKRILR